MRITGVIWLEEILEKIASKHRVREEEVVELLKNEPTFRFVESGHRPGDNVYSALGKTDAGRYLIVFFVYKMDGRALPVSARDMSDAERKRYGRK